MSGPGWQPQQPDDQQYPQQPPSQPAAYPPGFQPPGQQPPAAQPQQDAAYPPGFQPQQPPAPVFEPQQQAAAYPPGFQPQQAAAYPPGFQPQQPSQASAPGFPPQQPPQTPAPGSRPQQAAAYPPGFQPQQPSQTPAPGFQPQPAAAYPPGFQQQQAPPGFQPQTPPPGFQPLPSPQQDAAHQQQGASFIPGFDQTGPYQQQQWSPYPEQPKRKSKLPKILIIAAIVLLVLAGGGWVTWRIIYVSADEGATPISGQPSGKCAVSDGVLKGANTPVFTGGREEQNSFSCGYSIARGGSTVRTINVDVRTQANPENFEKDLARERQGSLKAGPKIGDKSMFRTYEHNDHTYLTLYVVKGDTIVTAGLYGYTKGFFGDTPAPLDQGEKDLEAVAKEVAAKN